jgi:hypothetical protein
LRSSGRDGDTAIDMGTDTIATPVTPPVRHKCTPRLTLAEQ